jgi:hypothetical protein
VRTQVVKAGLARVIASFLNRITKAPHDNIVIEAKKRYCGPSASCFLSSMLILISELSVLPMITVFVFFVSSIMAAIRTFKNGKTTARYDQQDPDYQQPKFFHDSIAILFLFMSRRLSCLTTDAEVLRSILDCMPLL